MPQHDITIEQGSDFSMTLTLRKPSGTNVASGSLVLGSLYYVNGYSWVKNGDNFYTDSNVFEATSTTYTSQGGGTVELMSAWNVNGYTAAGKIKDKFGGTLQATFVCTFTDPTNGKITISLTAATTAALTQWQNAFYDIEITQTSSSTVTRVLQGRAIFSSEVNT